MLKQSAGPSAFMASRLEEARSPQYFPTPPWATRALCEDLLELLPLSAETGEPPQTVWECACGAGHMALPLSEYFDVFASDLFDRGFNENHGPKWDFLSLCPDEQHEPETFDWIITNPPFGDNPQKFVERAFEHKPKKGVAVFVQLRWLETIDRTVELFIPNPPAMVGIFAERVPLTKGKYDPEAGTATAYCWVIWRTDRKVKEPVIRWIRPGAATRHFRLRDLDLVEQERAAAGAGPLFGEGGV